MESIWMLGFHLNNSLKITNVNLQHLLWNQSYIETCHILFVVVQVKDLQFSGCRLLPIQYFFSFMILNLNQEVSVLALRLSSTLWSGCWLFITIPISILNCIVWILDLLFLDLLYNRVYNAFVCVIGLFIIESHKWSTVTFLKDWCF